MKGTAKKNRGADLDVGEPMAAANKFTEITAGRDAAPERDDSPRRPTAISFTAKEYEYIKRIFDQKGMGLKVATAARLAVLWIADRVDDGTLAIGRNGITEKR